MNASTRGQWDWYAPHRRHIERLLVPPNPGVGRLCVLGAGNCNDLDLRYLTQAYAQVHLVDIDRHAVEHAVARQQIPAATADRITLHAPVDLTGIADLTRTWRGRPVPDHEVAAATRAAAAPVPPFPGGPFDLVLSPCVLSQLLFGVRQLIGEHHPKWPALKHALRARHLRTLTTLLAPTGRAVLVIDLTSTKSIPGLDRATEADAPAILDLAVREARCFRGLEPAALTTALRQSAIRSPITQSPPWIWHLGLSKAFLCYALTLTNIP
jgi:hypothetical protein